METHRFTREMGITHADFFRILPSAIDNHPYRRRNRGIEIQYGDRSVQIELGDEKIRGIALLQLPYIDMSFAFHGFSDNQREAFMKRFDLYFRRGGG